MPMPVSSTVSSTKPREFFTLTSTLPPGTLYFMAFSARLKIIW